MSLTLKILVACQALMMTANSLVVATSALVGASLAPDASLGTLPLALQFLFTMLSSLPASLFMGRFGRKAGFLTGGLIGLTGAIIAATAILTGHFWWFCVGAALSGIFNGFGIYYRFAATEVVEPDFRSEAISWVMAGGVVAAFAGPNLANWTREALPQHLFAGSYASVIVIYLLVMGFLAFSRFPNAGPARVSNEGRRLGIIMAQPRYVIAVICGALGYAVMSLVMTATPLAMAHNHHHFPDTAFVIQWHVLGMFAPSFFTGRLIHRFGIANIMTIGALFALCTITINLLGQSVWHFWMALLFLGVSWNFLFIGATTLLTETYTPEEKSRAQGANDFIVFTCVTLAALSAGALQNQFGWRTVNIGVLPLITIILTSTLWLKFRTLPKAAAAQ